MATLKDIEPSAKKVFELLQNKSYELNNEYYLRPKGDSKIEIVSLKPERPMNGVEEKADVVEDTYRNRNSIEFPKRNDAITYYEADVQAAFIRGMINGDGDFKGFKFVAAEFVLVGKNTRIDVVGIKNNTLYIFEIKGDVKDTKKYNKAFSQASEYCEIIKNEANWESYKSLLKFYPNMRDVSFDYIKPIAVLPVAKKHYLYSEYEKSAYWLFKGEKTSDFSNSLTSFEKHNFE
jgi:hypothetical protein